VGDVPIVNSVPAVFVSVIPKSTVLSATMFATATICGATLDGRGEGSTVRGLREEMLAIRHGSMKGDADAILMQLVPQFEN
jgi:hypothetical protein